MWTLRQIILIFSLLAVFLLFSEAGVNSFQVQTGERLAYSARFLYIIPVGSAEMRVGDTANYEGKRVFLITCEARTAKWLSLLFKAEATLNSYVDAKKLYPYRFEQVLRMAGRPDDIREASYDRANNIMEARGKGKKKVPADVQDPISAIYNLRGRELKEGAQINQTVNNNQVNYIFNAMVSGKKKIGGVNCWVLDSKIRRENKSMYHSMDAVIYISDDARRLPVLIQAKTKVGPVTLVLKPE